MALSDCPKCFDTPCECGYNYRNWDFKRLEELIKTLKKVLKEKKENDKWKQR